MEHIEYEYTDADVAKVIGFARDTAMVQDPKDGMLSPFALIAGKNVPRHMMESMPVITEAASGNPDGKKGVITAFMLDSFPKSLWWKTLARICEELEAFVLVFCSESYVAKGFESEQEYRDAMLKYNAKTLGDLPEEFTEDALFVFSKQKKVDGTFIERFDTAPINRVTREIEDFKRNQGSEIAGGNLGEITW